MSPEHINKLLKPYDYQIHDKRSIEAIMAVQRFWSLEKKMELFDVKEHTNKSTSTFAKELYLMITSTSVKKLDSYNQRDNFSVVPFQINIQVSTCVFTQLFVC